MKRYLILTTFFALSAMLGQAKEAYAVEVGSGNNIVTFYYDDNKDQYVSNWNVRIWEIDDSWHMSSDIPKTDIYKVKFDSSFSEAKPTSTSSWFNGCENLEVIEGMEFLNTSEVTDMSDMFRDCVKLKNLDLSHFNTSKVTDMSGLFARCHDLTLTSLDLSHFDTSNVTDMSEMFFGNNVQNLDLSHFDTSKVTDMAGIFSECFGSASLDLSHFDTSKVTDMSGMFAGCTSLISLNLSHFDTSKVTDMSGMFDQCDILTSLNLSSFDTSRVTNMENMFGGCICLTSIDLVGFDTSKVTDMSGMFSGCDVTSIDLGNFNTTKVTDMSGMFDCCESLTSIDLRSFDTSNVTDMEHMFSGCFSLTSIDLSSFDTSNVTDMSLMFANCNSLESLDLGHFDTSNVTAMWRMFVDCNTLASLDLSGFTIGEGTMTGEMLSNCSNLASLKLSVSMSDLAGNACAGVGTPEIPCILDIPYDFQLGVDHSSAPFVWKSGYFTLLERMVATLSADKRTLTFRYNEDETNYDGCQVFTLEMDGDNKPGWYSDRATITTVVFNPSFSNARPISTNSWFYDMSALETVEGMENLNTSAVTGMSYMFYGCSSLRSIDLSHLDLSGVTLMGYMFQGCHSLKSINLRNLDTSACSSFYRMFQGCSSLVTLDMSDLTFCGDATTSYMLCDCSGLRNLVVPASATLFKANACIGVGTAENPCAIYAPEEFDFGIDTSAGSFEWKKGYFKIGTFPEMVAESVSMAVGGSGKLSVCISNGDNVLDGYQFDIVLPRGFSLTGDGDGGFTYTLSNRYRGGAMSVAINQLSSTSYRVMVFSMSGAVLTGSDGVALTLYVSPSENTQPGSYGGRLENVSFSKADGFSFAGEDSAFSITVKRGASGDVNHDGTVNVSDVMAMVNHILGTQPAVFFEEEADVNADGKVNVSDVMSIVNIILSSTPMRTPSEYRMGADNLYLTPNGGDTYGIRLDASEPYTACEMTLRVPDGCTLMDVSPAGGSTSHKAVASDIGDNTYRLVVYTSQGEELSLSGKPLVNIRLDGDMRGQVYFSDIMLTNRLYENILLPDVECIPTGIDEITIDTGDTPIYNIQGMRIKAVKKGIYILNGKKYVK